MHVCIYSLLSELIWTEKSGIEKTILWNGGVICFDFFVTWKLAMLLCTNIANSMYKKTKTEEVPFEGRHSFVYSFVYRAGPGGGVLPGVQVNRN